MTMTVRPDTKARILDAAERLFAEQGFNDTSLRT
ncbi:MAG: TetR family transcriptional regulator, partial [Plesiomonas shigelloides]